MGRRELKKEVLSVLKWTNLPEILKKIEAFGEQELISPLFSALCNPDDLIRWHAVSVFGRIVPRLALRDIESARIVMRRFLWSLNDESGGIGWGAPEAMAEIMFHHQRLAEEYLHMLVSYMREDGSELFQDGNYIELPMLQRGLLWGIGRLASRYRQRLEEMGGVSFLEHYLYSPDGDVRGLAVWCLGRFEAESPIRKASQLGRDYHEFKLYREEGIMICTVAELVQQALNPHGKRL